MKFNSFLRNIAWEPRFLLSGSNLFYSVKKSLEIDLFYNIKLCSNQDYDGSL